MSGRELPALLGRFATLSGLVRWGLILLFVGVMGEKQDEKDLEKQEGKASKSFES